jgi:S1-C subfamily serine protease
LGNQRLFAGGDVVIAIDGEAVNSLESLQFLLETKYQVGDTVNVTLLRDGQELTLAVELAEEPIR